MPPKPPRPRPPSPPQEVDETTAIDFGATESTITLSQLTVAEAAAADGAKSIVRTAAGDGSDSAMERGADSTVLLLLFFLVVAVVLRVLRGKSWGRSVQEELNEELNILSEKVDLVSKSGQRRRGDEAAGRFRISYKKGAARQEVNEEFSEKVDLVRKSEMTRRSDGSQFPISYKRGAPYERACSTIDDDDESVVSNTLD